MANNGKDKYLGIFDMQTPAPFLHPALVEPKPYMENGKPKGDPKYGGVFVLPADHPDLKALKQKAAEVAKAEWGDDVDLSPSNIGWPFSSGTDYANERRAKGKNGDFYDGKAMLKARSKFEPMASWVANGKVVEVPSKELGPNASKFFSGVECLATFNFVPMIVDRKKYVTAYLNKVFATGKGERVGGGRPAAEAFKAYIGKATTADPTKGVVADDDIPF